MPRVKELKIISAQVPVEMVEQLQAIADSDDRTLSYVIRCALRDYIREHFEEKAA